MAKKDQMDLDSLSLKKILNIDMRSINRYPQSTLKNLARRLVLASNRRLKELESNKLTSVSSAYTQLRLSKKADAQALRKKQNKEIKKIRKEIDAQREMGVKGLRKPRLQKGKLKVDVRFDLPKDESRQDLMHIIKQAREFLSSKTSTAKGVHQVEKEMSMAVGRELTEKERKRVFKIFNQLEMGAFKLYGYDSKEIRDVIAKMVAKRKYGEQELTITEGGKSRKVKLTGGISEYMRNEDIIDAFETELQRLQFERQGYSESQINELISSLKGQNDLGDMEDAFEPEDTFKM